MCIIHTKEYIKHKQFKGKRNTDIPTSQLKNESYKSSMDC